LIERSMSLAELLKQLRTSAGLTQESLAEAARLSHRSISDLERGINLTARRETTRLLADALGLEGPDRAAFEAIARGHGSVTHEPPGKRGLAPDTTGVPVATRTLPRDVPSFTGRERELARLMNALETSEEAGATVVAIHAIDGMAGIGKTTFAVRVAHNLASRFPDGQIFLRLHGHTPGQHPVDPSDALVTLLLAIGVPAQHIPADMESRASLWRDRMSAKKALVILDDATGSDHVRPLLPSGAETLVLVTSRRRLAALPEALPLTLDILEPGQAAELFTRLVGRADVRVCDRGVIDLAKLCGYLPLAISLAAGQLKHHSIWTPADLAADLASAHDRLAAIHAEEHSVAAAFDLSYRDLNIPQQQLFRRLGLQPGADIDAYAATALAGTTLATTAELLEGLYAHHLVDEPVRGRYRFHDLIRAHAQSLGLADDAAGRSSSIDRLLAYYLHTARAADRHLARRTPVHFPIAVHNQPTHAPVFSARQEAVDWMDAERLNLHAVVDFAAYDDRLQYAIAIPAVMHGFLRTYGHWSQAVALHQTALNAARRSLDRVGEAAALTDMGDIRYLTGDYPAATASLTRAAELFHGLGDQLGEANSISTLGLVERATGNHQSAVRSQGRALELYRSAGDPRGEAVALGDLGFAQHLTGDNAAALTSLTQALQRYSDLGDQNGQATALQFLGIVQSATGDYSESVTSLTRSLALYRDTGTPWGEANALASLGDAQRLTGDTSVATANLSRALELYRNLGHRSGEAETLNNMGELAHASSRREDARTHHAQALDIARRIAAPLEEARALEGLGLCQLRCGQVHDGTAMLRQALGIYQRVSSPRAYRIEEVLRASA